MTNLSSVYNWFLIIQLKTEYVQRKVELHLLAGKRLYIIYIYIFHIYLTIIIII